MKKVFPIILGIICAFTTQAVFSAEDMDFKYPAPESNNALLVPITNVYYAIGDEYNAKIFEIEVPENGSYYVNFWLMAAQYQNGEFTTFNVFINDKYAGYIKPDKENWHSAKIQGCPKLDLNKGQNRIAITTSCPEIPLVESIKIASKEDSVFFSDTSYKSFFRNLKSVLNYSENNPENIDLTFYLNPHSSSIKAEQLPLIYTFYDLFSFKKGDIIHITGQSSSQFKIDVVFYGAPFNSINPNSDEISQIDPLGLVLPGTDPRNFKTVYQVKSATSEQTQGLNWLGISENTIWSPQPLLSMFIRIPEDGMYMIRARHGQNGGSDTASISINNQFFYNSVPITYNSIQTSIPANKDNIAILTLSDNPSKDDPIMFVHGVHADRIVGFNDDGPKKILQNYGASAYDSYLSQKYIYEASTISVSNYSSQEPISSCNILIGDPSEIYLTTESINNKKLIASKTISTTNIDGIDDQFNHFEISYSEGNINVSCHEQIKRISAFDITGKLLGTLASKEFSLSLPMTSLGLRHKGLYIITVETNTNLKSKIMTIN